MPATCYDGVCPCGLVFDHPQYAIEHQRICSPMPDPRSVKAPRQKCFACDVLFPDWESYWDHVGESGCPKAIGWVR